MADTPAPVPLPLIEKPARSIVTLLAAITRQLPPSLLRASLRREHHRPEGEHNRKKCCWCFHAFLP